MNNNHFFHFRTSNVLMIIFCLFILSCKKESHQILNVFKILKSEFTGIDFSNNLTSYPDFNMFNYMYFFNGAGVGAADVNNDGLIDLFFASNQGLNQLYINKSGMKFENKTKEAQIPNNGGWSTGISMVDINADGLMDIYISRVCNFANLHSKNQFLICQKIENGIPIYKDKSNEMGLDFCAFGTQAAFFDYDLDGDLDMYMMNHSLRFNGTFYPRDQYLNKYDSLAGDVLMRNDNGIFKNVTKSAGISGTIISYGLGIEVADINMDGYPDIYIANDFHENDYMYINNGDGTFTDELVDRTDLTSQFSMGVDIADINNDALPEIITLDMLPEDPYLIRRSLGEDSYNLFNHKLKSGYHPQFSRNTLQLNKGNTIFGEVGRYSGISASDWSWSALWIDFDNDGLKDLFISNGIPKRMNDIDYIKFIGTEDFQQKIKSNGISKSDMERLNKFPEIKLKNKFYKNKGNVMFADMESYIEDDQKSFSNGAVYADLDNDGDLDLVVNNVNNKAYIYENKLLKSKNKFLKIYPYGTRANINAIGSKALVYKKGVIQSYELYPVRGFLSSMNIPLNIGLGEGKVDSLIWIWPDNTFQKINFASEDNSIKLIYKSGLPRYNYKNSCIIDTTVAVQDLTSDFGIKHLHTENLFEEFDREILIPRMISRDGPAIATGDINKDGLIDFFIGSAKFDSPSIYLQLKNGKFLKMSQPSFEKNNFFEEVDAAFCDLDIDGDLDLITVNGGNEFNIKSENLKPAIYLNDGRGKFTFSENAIDNQVRVSASCILLIDYNQDGYSDIYIGGRSVPWQYGVWPNSYLLINNGHGHFDVDEKQSAILSKAGFVTGSCYADINQDGKNDITVATEWGGVISFEWTSNGFIQKVISNKKGWWNFLKEVDIDRDGDIDFVVGNAGLNNKFHATKSTPVQMLYEDFDNNGSKEQLLTYFLKGNIIPFHNQEELLKQLPSLKKKYLYAEDFANAKINEIIPDKIYKNSNKLEVDFLSSVILVNDGKGNFDIQELPWQTQLSSMKTCAIFDFNKDTLPDIFIGGNFYPNNIQMGRDDADCGSVLINEGKGTFKYVALSSLPIKGEIRKILPLKTKQKNTFLISKNNNFLQIVSINKH